MFRRIDKTKGSQKIMGYHHYQVHDSQLYIASHYSTIGAGSNQDVLIIPGIQNLHVNPEISVAGQSLLTLYEGVTVTANGNSIPSFNLNRRSSDLNLARFFSNPSWTTATGEILYQELMPGGATPPAMVGSSSKAVAEWIYSRFKKYILRITDQSVSTNLATINLQFYEDD